MVPSARQTVAMRLNPPPADSESNSIGGRDVTTWHSTWGRRLETWATDIPGVERSWVRWVVTWRAAIVAVVLGGVVAILATALAAEVYEQVTEEDDGLAALDRPLLDWMKGHRPDWLADTATWITHTGGQYGLPLLVVLSAAWLWWRRRSIEPLVVIAVTGVVSLGMTIAGKWAIGRSRPPVADAVPPFESSPAFPSGHTLNATALALVIGYLLLLTVRSRSARILICALVVVYALVIGLTRVYLGHHWLTDVVAGWALAAAWAAIVITAHRLYLTVWHDHHRQAKGTGTGTDT